MAALGLYRGGPYGMPPCPPHEQDPMSIKILNTEVAVIGAGVIGLATALRLIDDGHEVVMIDPNDPGSGASYGNAATIANYAITPVGSPQVLRDLPSLLFDRNSPLAIRKAAIFALAPWLARFMVQSLPAATERNIRALAEIVMDAGQRWSDLATHLGDTEILQKRGYIQFFKDSAALQAATSGYMDKRARFGLQVEALDAASLAQMEPGLPPSRGGLFFPGAMHLADPGRMTALMAARVRAKAQILRSHADRIERIDGGVRVIGPDIEIRARHAVIAAGAYSRGLARSAGDRVPLETERGYHLEWDGEEHRLTRPCCPPWRGFYMSPLAGRLRAAGTVELGGLTAPPSRHRLDRILEGVREIFPDIGAPTREWLGFRPSMPDSLPVVGSSRLGPEVVHAYGHGHIGLTLAPMTAEMVADLIGGRRPHAGMAALSPTRF